MRLRRDGLRLAMGCALGLAVGSPGWAIPAAPEIMFTIDGTPTTVPAIAWTINPDGTAEATFLHCDVVVGDCDGLPGDVVDITLNAFMDPDPQIIYAASVIDFGTPSTFGFIFSQGIVATAAPGTASHSHSSSTTDGGTGSLCPTALGPSVLCVTAVAPPAGLPVDTDGIPEIAVYTLSTNGGVTFLNAGLDLSPSFTTGAGSAVQGPFNPASVAGPAGSGSYDVMRVDVNFSMSGGNDTYTFNGTATIVPEPGLLGVFGLGLAGLALHVRRRSRR